MNEVPVSREPESAEASAKQTPALASADSGSRLTLVLVGAFIAIVGLAVWYFAIRDRGPKDDFSRIQGEWKVTRPGDDATEGEMGPANVIRVEGDRWTYVSGGRETSSWRVTLNPDVQPREIDLTRLEVDGEPARFTYGARKGAEVKQLGVYSLDGETFKLTLAPVLEGRPKALDGDVPSLTLTRGVK